MWGQKSWGFSLPSLIQNVAHAQSAFTELKKGGTPREAKTSHVERR